VLGIRPAVCIASVCLHTAGRMHRISLCMHTAGRMHCIASVISKLLINTVLIVSIGVYLVLYIIFTSSAVVFFTDLRYSGRPIAPTDRVCISVRLCASTTTHVTNKLHLINQKLRNFIRRTVNLATSNFTFNEKLDYFICNNDNYKHIFTSGEYTYKVRRLPGQMRIVKFRVRGERN